MCHGDALKVFAFETKIVSRYTKIKSMQFIYYAFMVTFFLILGCNRRWTDEEEEELLEAFAIQIKKRLNVSTKAIRYAQSKS